MKLEEITKVPQQPTPGFSLDDFNVDAKEQIGTAENIPIVKMRGVRDVDLVAYALVIDDRVASMIVGKLGDLDGPAFYIYRTYTLPDMRNRGLITALYKALYKKYNIRLVSDVEQSPETISVWKKLAGEFPVKVFDEKNRQLLDLRDVTDQQLYDPTQELRLVLESVVVADCDWITVPPIIDGILKDYIHYTADENKGQYD